MVSPSSINYGYHPMTSYMRSHLCLPHHCINTKIITMMIGMGVKDKVDAFRDVNKKVGKGLRKMEFNAYKRIHNFRN